MIALLLLAAAQPEGMGPFAIDDMEIGPVMADGVSIPIRIYAAQGMNLPVVAVVHGFAREGRYMAVMAQTLASHGYVAVVPDMPCGFAGCDHDANARQLAALMEWAVTQSPVMDRIDGTRRGLIGHSWGGLAVHKSAAIDPTIDVVVALDPNEDRGAGLAAAPSVTIPNAHVMAEVAGFCNGDWGTSVYPETGTPHLRVRIATAGHCDVEDPTDATCAFACTAGNPQTTPLFRRYGIAFLSCVLDAANGDYVGGAAMIADEAAGTIDMVDHAGLETLPCRMGLPPIDAGAPDVTPGEDAATIDDAGTATPDAAPGEDAAIAKDAGPGADASPPIDRGPPPSIGPEAGGGCGCAASGGSSTGGAAFAFIGIAAMLGYRRRSDPSMSPEKMTSS
jgi:MYXO-CTERM domain-containing protein